MGKRNVWVWIISRDLAEFHGLSSGLKKKKKKKSREGKGKKGVLVHPVAVRIR